MGAGLVLQEEEVKCAFLKYESSPYRNGFLGWGNGVLCRLTTIQGLFQSEERREGCYHGN